ncbi:MAG: GTPase domain-containing protein [Tolypothrix carrinoi HA7290-LM1]|jgi:GTPase SAR1 family protein|nr:GTPase domain-containing protein [Tolypothrix carrinoi HA7290-LM1]
MRIVEIGHEGVGKTTFMASMYGTLQRGIEGFSLRATYINDHNRLIKLAKNIEQNKYPAPTDQRHEYQFYLQYQGKDIFPFTWADYRGGAIRETQDSEQARLLQKDLQQADGVLIFCDCQALVQKDSRRNQIGRMTALITNALKNIERPIGLAVVLTKADLVDELNEDDLKIFEGLSKAIKISNYIASMMIPVACGPEPINVQIPLLFVLYIGVFIQANYLAKEIEEHQQMAEYYEKQTHGFGGFVQELWDIFQGNTTYRAMSQDSLEKAIAKYKELEPLIEPVEALKKYLSIGE